MKLSCFRNFQIFKALALRGARAKVHETLHHEVELLLEAKVVSKAQGNHHVVVISQGG